MDVTLSLTSLQRDQLRDCVLPQDRREAGAIVLCGNHSVPDRYRLMVREIHPIPSEAYVIREHDLVRWRTEFLPALLERANQHGWSVVKVHGHGAGWPRFSRTDDESDQCLLPALCNWVDAVVPHASVVLLSDGRMFGRWVSGHTPLQPLERITVVGDSLDFYFGSDFFGDYSEQPAPEFTLRHAQAFGQKTTALLTSLTVGVIGCSGTGSPVIEQLARLGIGHLVLVDPDIVEEKNLNRILNSTMEHAHARARKVDVLAKAVCEMGLGTRVSAYPSNLLSPDAVRAVAGCDVVFGCMDGVEGRHTLNRLATFYTLPYFDLGVKLQSDGRGGLDNVSGAVHYLQPGRSSLLSRHVFTLEDLRAEGMRRQNPGAYEAQRREKYIKGVQEDQPAVISVNMLVSSMGMNDLLARIHNYRTDGNGGYAEWYVSLSHMSFYTEAEKAPCLVLSNHVGRGDVIPLLDNPELSE